MKINASLLEMNLQSSLVLAILPITLLFCASCSSTSPSPPPAESTSVATFKEGVPGGISVNTIKVTATITAVDHEKRQATLLTADGKKTDFKAAPEVVNFDQIHVGDHVKATLTEELVVYVREKGETRRDGQASLIALAPKGAKPAAVMADTIEVTAKVKSVDLKAHKATLEFPDGSTHTVSVRPDVKLSTTDVGREVVIQATEAVAVQVEKPKS